MARRRGWQWWWWWRQWLKGISTLQYKEPENMNSFFCQVCGAAPVACVKTYTEHQIIISLYILLCCWLNINRNWDNGFYYYSHFYSQNWYQSQIWSWNVTTEKSYNPLAPTAWVLLSTSSLLITSELINQDRKVIIWELRLPLQNTWIGDQQNYFAMQTNPSFSEVFPGIKDPYCEKPGGKGEIVTLIFIFYSPIYLCSYYLWSYKQNFRINFPWDKHSLLCFVPYYQHELKRYSEPHCYPWPNITVILGNFNAVPGCDHTTYKILSALMFREKITASESCLLLHDYAIS